MPGEGGHSKPLASKLCVLNWEKLVRSYYSHGLKVGLLIRSGCRKGLCSLSGSLLISQSWWVSLAPLILPQAVSWLLLPCLFIPCLPLLLFESALWVSGKFLEAEGCSLQVSNWGEKCFHAQKPHRILLGFTCYVNCFFCGQRMLPIIPVKNKYTHHKISATAVAPRQCTLRGIQGGEKHQCFLQFS